MLRVLQLLSSKYQADEAATAAAALALDIQAKATFFAISAASLVGPLVGESERMMRTLFQVANERAPSFVFIDEIDSMLSARRILLLIVRFFPAT